MNLGCVVDYLAMEAASSAFEPGTAAYKAKLQRMQEAVRVLLAGVGEDVTREGLVDTPKVSCPF
jgi:GTP cyclohydrolase I